METITIEDFSFTYPNQEYRTLRDISLTIQESGFYLLCGQSGCGKSTLLRHMKKSLVPYGDKMGMITYHGIPIEELNDRVAASEIGYVTQNPQDQIVTDKVWHELAFGLENMGLSQEVIRRRVAEMANFFGIQTWFRQNTDALSGGQLQMVNLASVMVMQPKVLILDEPTSQLDPMAATDFLQMLHRINQELGTTIIICEHRLEEVFPMADYVIVMDEGSISMTGAPSQVAEQLITTKDNAADSLRPGLPAAIRIAQGMKDGIRRKAALDSWPITVRQGRLWMEAVIQQNSVSLSTHPAVYASQLLTAPAAIQLQDVWFRYERNSMDILRGCEFCVHKGEWFALLGGNGAGKSTLLQVITNYQKPYRGKVILQGQESKRISGGFLGYEKLVMLPQEPKSLFTEITVEEELTEVLENIALSQKEQEETCRVMLHTLGLESLAKRHPYDLSGGEQQRLALGKLLLLRPSILLLDEPTKGLDPQYKISLAEILCKYQQTGMTILMVSHDVEFCSTYANRCGMFFDGQVIAVSETHAFFGGNNFYTTAANRIARKWFPQAITSEEVVKQWQEA